MSTLSTFATDSINMERYKKLDLLKWQRSEFGIPRADFC